MRRARRGGDRHRSFRPPTRACAGRRPRHAALAVGHAARERLRLLLDAVGSSKTPRKFFADLLDAGVIFGTGFAPFRGGPLNYLAGLKKK